MRDVCMDGWINEWVDGFRSYTDNIHGDDNVVDLSMMLLINNNIIIISTDSSMNSLTYLSISSWLVRALAIFADRHDGCLPHNGQLPDLTCTTDMYVQLQKVYQLKALHDLNEFKSILSDLLKVRR